MNNIRNNIQTKFPNLKPIFAYAIAAILGDLSGSGWLCPAEVVKQQLQAGKYDTTTQAVASIWKKQGIRGFYHGYLGGVVRDVPFRVFQMTSYEVAKSLYLKFKKSRQARHWFFHHDSSSSSSLDLTAPESAVLGGIAGCVSAVATQPMDVMRTLMMTNGAEYGNSMVQCFQSVFHQNGIRGIYRGTVTA